MTKTTRFEIRLSDEEKKMLVKKARANHFISLSTYIRFVLLRDSKLEEMITKIYEVVQNECHTKT